MRVSFRPMKAQLYEPKRIVFPCYGQYKLDGIRASYINDQFVSGDGKVWNEPVVKRFLDALRKADLDDMPLDGEIYRHGWKLQRINSAVGVNRLQPTSETAELTFTVFDCIDGETDFFDRWLYCVERLKSAGFDREHPIIPRVRTKSLANIQEADKFYCDAVAAGYEGVIYRMPTSWNGKRVDQGYQSGRVHWMLKRKEKFDAEFKIVDMLEGKMTDKGGKHVGRMGALVCVTKKGHRFHVGTGFDDKERELMWKNSPVGKWLRVEYGCLSSDGIPLRPTSLGTRDYA